MAWEFEMVAGPFNPRLTEGPAWDGDDPAVHPHPGQPHSAL